MTEQKQEITYEFLDDHIGKGWCVYCPEDGSKGKVICALTDGGYVLTFDNLETHEFELEGLNNFCIPIEKSTPITEQEIRDSVRKWDYWEDISGELITIAGVYWIHSNLIVSYLTAKESGRIEFYSDFIKYLKRNPDYKEPVTDSHGLNWVDEPPKENYFLGFDLSNEIVFVNKAEGSTQFYLPKKDHGYYQDDKGVYPKLEKSVCRKFLSLSDIPKPKVES